MSEGCLHQWEESALLRNVLDSIVRWLHSGVRNAKHAIRMRWMIVWRLGGDFAQAESSERARRLTGLWESRWPGSEPLSYMMDARNVWVRFHSLPESKRYADDASEMAEIVRRRQAVIRELSDLSGSTALMVIATDYFSNDAYAGWSKKYLVDAWPWRTCVNPDYADIEIKRTTFYFWVANFKEVGQLTPLLESAAEDEAKIVITNPDMTWVYAPYDGGADVFAPTAEDRDRLKTTHREWLSDHPAGL